MLTIAIPTYNRPNKIRKKLDYFCSIKYEGCKLLVVDNSYQDDTERVVSGYYDQLKGLSYHRNATNIGYDANVLKCLEYSETQYVWVLSDDDDFYKDAPNKILAIIRAHNPDLILLNDSHFDKLTFKSLSTLSGKIIELDLGMPMELRDLDEEDRFAYVSAFFWLSRLVVNKSKISDLDSLRVYIGTQVMQLAIVNKLFIGNDTIVIVITDKALVKNNPHCVFSSNFINVFVDGIYRFCRLESSFYSEDFSRYAASKNIPFVSNSLLSHKIGNSVVKYDYRVLNLVKRMVYYRVGIIEIIRFIVIKIIPRSFLLMFIKGGGCDESTADKTYI